MLLQAIPASEVPIRQFFLENLNQPWIMNVIRIAAVGILLFFIVSYFYYKNK